jgi:hypothetical protein
MTAQASPTPVHCQLFAYLRQSDPLLFPHPMVLVILANAISSPVRGLIGALDKPMV